MNVKERVARELDRMASGDVDPRRPGLLTLDAEHGRLTSELVAIDTIGCAFTQMALATEALAGAQADDLKQLGDRLAQRLNYLLEPIGTLELDIEGFTLQMRSHPPRRDADGHTYYELSARRGGEVRLNRYRKALAETRVVVPAEVTREVFARLAADLDAAVQ